MVYDASAYAAFERARVSAIRALEREEEADSSARKRLHSVSDEQRAPAADERFVMPERNCIRFMTVCKKHTRACEFDRGMLVQSRSVLDGSEECMMVHRCEGFINDVMENENLEPCVAYLEGKCDETGDGDSRRCFWCDASVDVINMESTFGRLALTSMMFLCPNAYCHVKCKGLASFEEHIERCDQGIEGCSNNVEVGGLKFGCFEWVDPTTPHECAYDVRHPDPEKSASAKRLYLEVMSCDDVLVNDVKEFMLTWFSS
eukprot:jgi/Mesvir1/19844/Mv13134-RA.1